MRIVFMGSPDFAARALGALIDSGHEIVAVFTQPDRPVGRGRKLSPPPVKRLALQHGLQVCQPPSISAPAVVDEIRAMQPDVGVIAAYGQILKQPVLDVPRLGVLNVHASLLPRWRGASPVIAAILAGDTMSGATIMRVVQKLDAGPVLDQVEVPVRPDDTTFTLTERIADAGAALLLAVLPRYASRELTPREQDETRVTYAPQVKKSDAIIDWERESAGQIERKVRAYNPWPVAHSYLAGLPLRIIEAVVSERRSHPDTPGTIVAAADGGLPRRAGFVVTTGDLDVAVITVQGPGGRPMSAADYLNGHREILGKRLRSAPDA